MTQTRNIPSRSKLLVFASVKWRYSGWLVAGQITTLLSKKTPPYRPELAASSSFFPYNAKTGCWTN